MNEKIDSNSDSDDADYVPAETEEFANSSEESDNESETSTDDECREEHSTTGTNKRNRKRKRIKLANSEKCDGSIGEDKLSADALWEDFKRSAHALSNRRSVLGDLGDDKKTKTSAREPNNRVNGVDGDKPSKNNLNSIINNSGSSEDNNSLSANGVLTTSNVKSVHNRRPKVPGLAAVINQLEKKNKFSILDKSKSDWNSFKSKEGISSSLEAYNKGKHGYLERQDFLQRTDLRRFEIEKKARNQRRGRQSLRR